MKLTPENYYDLNQDYMSSSQYRQFQKCEAMAMAEIRGDYKRPFSTALLQGSYLDAYVEGTIDQFVNENPDLISSRGPTKGQLKAEYRQLDTIIKRFERDPLFMSYLEGDKQRILTGEIAGIKFKCKIDILSSDRIVDFKTVRDFETIYDPEIRTRVNFIEFWGYDIQLAIYQELARQNGLGDLSCFIAAVTKETVPDLALVHIPQKVLDLKLEEVEYHVPMMQAVKLGIAEPHRCEKCDWCKETKMVEVIELEDLNDD